MNIFCSANSDENITYREWLNDQSSAIAARDTYVNELKNSPTHFDNCTPELVTTVFKQLNEAKDSKKQLKERIKILKSEDFLIARLFRKAIFVLFGYKTAYDENLEQFKLLKENNQQSLGQLKTLHKLFTELPTLIEVFSRFSQECPNKKTYNEIKPLNQIKLLKRELQKLEIQGESKFSRDIKAAETLVREMGKRFFNPKPQHISLAERAHLMGSILAPKGISNEGNTCYLASLLQVMRAVPFFKAFVENEEVLGLIFEPETDVIQDINPLRDAIREFFKQMDNEPKSFTTGVHDKIRKELYELKLIDSLHGQCDSVELLVKIMDLFGYRFHTKMQCTSTLSDVEDSEDAGLDLPMRGDLEFNQQEVHNFSLPINLYPEQAEDQNDLAVLFQTQGLRTDSSEKVAFKEQINDAFKTRIAHRRQEFSFGAEMPEVIPIVRMSPENNTEFKSVPLRFHPAGQERESYVLMATIHHSGGPEGGHYYAHIRKDDETFYCCDDRQVKEVNLTENSQALNGELIYFYTKEH